MIIAAYAAIAGNVHYIRNEFKINLTCIIP